MGSDELRGLKDKAARAVQKRQWSKAAKLYLEIADAEAGDPDWRQRAGEALRMVGDVDGAVTQLVRAADTYARRGEPLKAIAVCKAVLKIAPGDELTQKMLAALYAKRERTAEAVKKAAARPPAATEMVRTPSGIFKVVPRAEPPRPSAGRAAPPSRNRVDPVEPLLGLAGSVQLVPIEERRRGHTPVAIPPATPPLEALQLNELLPRRRTQPFGVIDRRESSGYEIVLDGDDLIEEVIEEAPPPSVERPTRRQRKLVARELALPRIPLFSSLSPDDLRRLVERAQVRDCAAGDIVVEQGEPGSSLFVIVRGLVQVSVDVEAPAPSGTPLGRKRRARRVDIGSLGDGAFFGELGVLTDSPRMASVVAAEPTQLIEISRDVISELVRRSPEVLRTLMRFFRDRLVERVLATSPLFTSLQPNEARELARRFVFLELERETPMIAAGQSTHGLFVILCGEAVVRDRRGHDVGRLSSGDMVGESSLVTNEPASITVHTVTKCWVLELPRAQLEAVVERHPGLLAQLEAVAAATASSRPQRDSRVDFF